MTDLYGWMEKRAVVDKRVKQYRRALQMLEQGTHDWHGTANLQGVANMGALAPGPRAAMGTGVYFFEGKPNHGYWHEGGAAVPHEALSGATRLPFNNDLGEANLLTQGKVPLKPVDVKVPADGLSPAQRLIKKRIDPTRFEAPKPGVERKHTYLFAEHGNQGALRDVQQKNHVRTVDVDVLNLARRSVSDWKKHHTAAPDGSGRGRLLQVLDEMHWPTWGSRSQYKTYDDPLRVPTSNRLSVPAATAKVLDRSTIGPARPLSPAVTPKWYLPYTHALMKYGPLAGGLAMSMYGAHRHRQDLDAALKEYNPDPRSNEGEGATKSAFDWQDAVPAVGSVLGYGAGRVAQKYVKNPYAAAGVPSFGALMGYALTDLPQQIHRGVRDAKKTDAAFAQYLDRVRNGEDVPSLRSREEAFKGPMQTMVDGGRDLNKRITDLMMGRPTEPITLTHGQRFQRWRTGQPVYTPASDEEKRIVEHLRKDPSVPYRDTKWKTLMELGVLAPVTEWHKMYAQPGAAQ